MMGIGSGEIPSVFGEEGGPPMYETKKLERGGGAVYRGASNRKGPSLKGERGINLEWGPFIFSATFCSFRFYFFSSQARLG